MKKNNVSVLGVIVIRLFVIGLEMNFCTKATELFNPNQSVPSKETLNIEKDGLPC